MVAVREAFFLQAFRVDFVTEDTLLSSGLFSETSTSP